MTYGSNISICRRCILPSFPPYIELNEEGLCSLCRLSFKQKRQLLESDFVKIIKNYRKRDNKYDCFVMCSGGKDSTFALYCMKERYKMNPLAFTFDHGFLAPQALANIKNAINILGIDWLYLKTNEFLPLLKFALTQNKNIYICYLCSLWHMNLAFEVAKEKHIRLLIAGWTLYQSDLINLTSAYLPLSEPVYNFLRKYGKRFNLKYYNSTVLKKKHRQILVTSPLWYLNLDESEIKNIIRDKLGWKQTEESYPAYSTNCQLNYLSSYLALKAFGYTHYHIEMSQMIREGKIGRQEAQKRLAFVKDSVEFDKIYDKIGLNRNERSALGY